MHFIFSFQCPKNVKERSSLFYCISNLDIQKLITLVLLLSGDKDISYAENTALIFYMNILQILKDSKIISYVSQMLYLYMGFVCLFFLFLPIYHCFVCLLFYLLPIIHIFIYFTIILSNSMPSYINLLDKHLIKSCICIFVIYWVSVYTKLR